MKKMLIACGLVLLGLQNVSAQNEDTWIPQQLGIGVGVGTTGITIDASTTLNRWLGVRAGVNIFPKFKLSTDLDLGTERDGGNVADLSGIAHNINNAAGSTIIDIPNGGFPETIDVEGKLSNTTFHFLVDVYPFKTSSFRATVGFYIGGKELISVYNKQDGILKSVTQWNEIVAKPTVLPESARPYAENRDMIGAELGDYFITPDQSGNLKATIEVAAFRPYIGIGFGHAVPRKSRVGCQFDLGVQMWGTPKVYVPIYDRETGRYSREALEADRSGEGGDAIKLLSNFSVYPTMTLRLVGRIF